MAAFDGSYKLLIIEDDPLTRKVLWHVLTSDGLQVEVSDSATAGLELAGTTSFHIIILDLNLPDLDGIETAKRLRVQGVHCPLIGLTATDNTSERFMQFKAVCTEGVTKPIRRPQLLEVVHRHLLATKLEHTPVEDMSFAELTREYIATLPGTMASLRQSLTENRIEDVRKVAHRLRGTAGMYGLRQLGETAGLLECAILEKRDLSLIADLLTELEQDAERSVGRSDG